MSDSIASLIEMDIAPRRPATAQPQPAPIPQLDLVVDTAVPSCVQCSAKRPVDDSGTCQPCYDAANSVSSPTTLTADLAAIGAQASANASVQGIGSMAGGQLRGVGFSSRAGYITALRNGVPAHTYQSYLTTLRSQFGMTSADINALELPGPMLASDRPVGVGVVHAPTGPSVFDRPKAERAFIVGPSTDVVEPAAPTKLEHGQLIAGATAEGHGVLVGWRGERTLTRGALVGALESLDLAEWAADATSARAQAGRAIGILGVNGYVVRVERRPANAAANVTHWSVGAVNHTSAIGEQFGTTLMRAQLTSTGQLFTDGDETLGARVREDFKARVAAEVYQAADVTAWLGGILRSEYTAVRFGVGWYVPARYAEAAGKLCQAVANLGWGSDWILPALPVATSDQLRDGIVRGLTDEVSGLIARLATERATAWQSAPRATSAPSAPGRSWPSCAASASGSWPSGRCSATSAWPRPARACGWPSSSSRPCSATTTPVSRPGSLACGTRSPRTVGGPEVCCESRRSTASRRALALPLWVGLRGRGLRGDRRGGTLPARGWLYLRVRRAPIELARHI